MHLKKILFLGFIDHKKLSVLEDVNLLNNNLQSCLSDYSKFQIRWAEVAILFILNNK